MRLAVFLLVVVDGNERRHDGSQTERVEDPVECDLLAVLERAEQRALFGEHEYRLE